MGLISKIRHFYLLALGLPQTLRFNFRYFSFSHAVLLPCIVSHRVVLEKMDGEVSIHCPVQFGLVRIGFGDVGIFDQDRSRSVWRVAGRVVFNGSARLGHGTKISVDQAGVLSFGSDVEISAESSIACRNSIVIDDGSLISWDVQIMDSDWHKVLNEQNVQVNLDSEVKLGKKVWVGSRVLILKGVEIGDGSVVAAGAVVTKKFPGTCQLLAGNPAKISRTGVTWSH